MWRLIGSWAKWESYRGILEESVLGRGNKVAEDFGTEGSGGGGGLFVCGEDEWLG